MHFSIYCLQELPLNQWYLFSCLYEMGMTFQKLIKTKILFFFALNHSDVVFILLINVKMPTIIGILTFMSRININLSSVEHEKSYACNLEASVELTSSKYPLEAIMFVFLMGKQTSPCSRKIHLVPTCACNIGKYNIDVGIQRGPGCPITKLRDP